MAASQTSDPSPESRPDQPQDASPRSARRTPGFALAAVLTVAATLAAVAMFPSAGADATSTGAGATNPPPSAPLAAPAVQTQPSSQPSTQLQTQPSSTSQTASTPASPAVTLVPSPNGFLVVKTPINPTFGTKKKAPVTTYTVEVHPSLRSRAAALQSATAKALGDPVRGWTAHGEFRLRQVNDPAKARVRIVLAPADLVNQYCTRIGLPTAGLYSCWDGSRTMLNGMRWKTGAPWFPSLDAYRTYLINHEFGHALGKQHQGCPRPGALSPLMVQQSKSTYGCRANSWPYPKSKSAGA